MPIDVPDPINPERIRDALAAAEEFDDEFTAVWQREFYAVEQSLVDEGYTCDQLAPEGRPCIACETSKRLRARLAPLILGMVTVGSTPPNQEDETEPERCLVCRTPHEVDPSLHPGPPRITYSAALSTPRIQEKE